MASDPMNELDRRAVSVSRRANPRTGISVITVTFYGPAGELVRRIYRGRLLRVMAEEALRDMGPERPPAEG